MEQVRLGPEARRQGEETTADRFREIPRHGAEEAEEVRRQEGCGQGLSVLSVFYSFCH